MNESEQTDVPTNPAEVELEVQRRVKAMKDQELVDMVREAIVKLEILSDRLASFASDELGGKHSA